MNSAAAAKGNGGIPARAPRIVTRTGLSALPFSENKTEEQAVFARIGYFQVRFCLFAHSSGRTIINSRTIINTRRDGSCFLQDELPENRRDDRGVAAESLVYSVVFYERRRFYEKQAKKIALCGIVNCNDCGKYRIAYDGKCRRYHRRKLCSNA